MNQKSVCGGGGFGAVTLSVFSYRDALLDMADSELWLDLFKYFPTLRADNFSYSPDQVRPLATAPTFKPLCCH
jgi:hypothetical protein